MSEPYVEIEIRIRRGDERTQVFRARKVKEPRLETNLDLANESIFQHWGSSFNFGVEELEVTLTFTALADENGTVCIQEVVP